MRIVFFGDSLTWGGYGGDYVAAVAAHLPHDEIINAGQGGNTVLNLLARLEDDVLAHKPEGVFVMVGGNDTTSYVQPLTRPYYKQVQKVPEGVVTPTMFAQAYRELLTQLQFNHVQTWVGLPPKEYNPATVEATIEFNRIAADVARSLRVPTLDLMAHFKPDHIPERPPLDLGYINLIGKRLKEGWADHDAEQQRGGFSFTFDGLHFTEATAQKVAALVLNFIKY